MENISGKAAEEKQRLLDRVLCIFQLFFIILLYVLQIRYIKLTCLQHVLSLIFYAHVHAHICLESG